MSKPALRCLAILTLCAAAAACTGNRPSPDPGRPPGSSASSPTVLPLQPFFGNLKTVDVKVGGETLPFLFDTGGGITIITPDVAKKAGCEPFGRLSGFRYNAERVDAQRCGPIEISLGSLALREEAAVFDLSSMLGGPKPLGGILSLDVLQGRAFTLDIAGGRLVLETPRSLAERVRGLSPLTIRPGRQAGGASLDLMLAVRTPQGPIWLEIDSGSAGPVLLSPHALRQLGATLPPDAPQKLRLDVLGLGPVEVIAVEKDIIYDGLLNSELLSRMVLTVDLGTMKAWASVRDPEASAETLLK
jgi:hypothetical protein